MVGSMIHCEVVPDLTGQKKATSGKEGRSVFVVVVVVVAGSDVMVPLELELDGSVLCLGRGFLEGLGGIVEMVEFRTSLDRG